MDERNLLKVALICSIIGVFIIFIFADRLEPSLMNISDISDSMIDQSVKIQGEIVAVRNTPSVSILDVEDDGGSIKVVAFDDENSGLSKGQFVEVFGDIQDYEGLLEIEAKKIKII